MAPIVDSISVTPKEAVPGESVLVEALGPGGESLANDSSAVVRINGIRGARQYLQFPYHGVHPLHVTAWREGSDSEEADASVTIVGDDVALPDGNAGIHLRSLALVPDVGVPLLRVAQTPSTPTTVGLSLGRGTQYFAGLTTSLAHGLTSKTAKTALSGAILTEFNASPGAAFGILKDSPLKLLPQPDQPPVTYTWDFGDGSTLVTTEATTEHDYAAALGADQEHYQFDVRVRVERTGEEPVEVVRTLSMFNAYAMCKHLGTIVPRARASRFASKAVGGYTFSVTVENIEDVPITLTHRLITPALADGGDLAMPVRSEELPSPVTIAAHSTVAIPVSTDKDVVPKDATGISVVFAGTTEHDMPVRVEAHAEISHEDQTTGGLRLGGLAVTHLRGLQEAIKRVVNPAGPPAEFGLAERALGKLGAGKTLSLGKMGQFALAQHLTPAMHEAHLQILHAGGHAGALSAAKLDALQAPLAGAFGAVAVAHALDLAEDADAKFLPVRQLWAAGLVDGAMFDLIQDQVPEDGKECDQDNLPDDLGDWVCQATTEKREVIMPGRFENARKGDIVLSPGGMGPIGGLLRSVMPPQRYSHSGIMTRNYDTITHSTASEQRLMDYPVGSILGDPYPTEGHRPDVLKYAWPGVVTQPVEQAIHGGDMVDPESKKTYSISSFSSRNEFMEIGGVWEVVPPLVVKPDPMVETPDLRRLLHKVADAARDATGKSHYRFYCYTDPTIGETTVAPDDAGWAKGTFPSVCSSFIWMMMKRNGIQLESGSALVAEADLEAADKAAGAQRNAQTRDGLYLYSARERRDAADYLFNYLHEKVRTKEGDKGILGEFAEAFSDMADDVANQMTNAFASDWCDTEAKDSEAWKQTQDANAVSPDNILLWDSPSALGLHGYAVPVNYLEPRREVITIHRWKLVPTRGTLSGTVRQNGAAIAGAMVQLYDGMTDFTDASGRYRLEKVPFGDYEVKAAKDGGPVYLSAAVPFHLDQPEAALDIELKGPSEDFRVVKVSGNINMVDYEDFTDDEIGNQPFYGELFVGPYGTHADKTFVGKTGGEVRVEFRVVVDWQLDRSVAIWYENKFFEGASEDTDDLDGITDRSINVAADYWQSWKSNIKSGGAGESHVDVTFENAINPN